ncbi:MAG: hypothetical protein O7A66_03755 [Alphaproteobacteria bacterium]|nr:hypothetical protein [Alphaproteobacteria bacterium]
MSESNEPQENKPESNEPQENQPEDTEPQEKQMPSVGKQIMALGVIVVGIVVLLGGGLFLSKFLG